MTIALKNAIRKADGERVLAVFAPPHPRFVRLMLHCKAVWMEKDGCWMIDRDREEDVLKAYMHVFRADPYTDPKDKKVNVVVSIDGLISETEYWGLGRLLLSRYKRDHKVRTGKGVKLLEGEFYTSGGSVKRPWIGQPCGDRAVLLVRGVPLGMANRWCEHTENMEIAHDSAK